MTVGSLGDTPLVITDELVHALLTDQFPHLAAREIGRHYTLEDHVSVRVGDDYGAIFPTIPGLDDAYERTAGLIAPLSGAWTFPWSGPLDTGAPGHGYPYHWVIVKWITASTAGFVPLHCDSAPSLGDALRQLHQKAPAHAPTSPTTATTLHDLTPAWEQLLEDVAQIVSAELNVIKADVARTLWSNALDATTAPSSTWTHGNLEPRAILSDQGKFAGLLLWHSFGAGNPEADLGAAAVLLPTSAREAMLAAYGKVGNDAVVRIQGFELLAALRYIRGGDPFRARLAWERLLELDVARAA